MNSENWNKLSKISSRGKWVVWVVVVLISSLAPFKYPAAQLFDELKGKALVNALREGGYNIYFRHAATDWSQEDQVYKKDDWISCDSSRMRQLSDAGRRTAESIGNAIRSLKIPVGQIFASPYCRTVETVRYMQLGSVKTTTDIINMRVAAYFGGESTIAERTRQRLSIPPQPGTNTVLVAHGNVLVTATDVYPQEAEAIVFRPESEGQYSYVARISPRQWERLAADYGSY